MFFLFYSSSLYFLWFSPKLHQRIRGHLLSAGLHASNNHQIRRRRNRNPSLFLPISVHFTSRETTALSASRSAAKHSIGCTRLNSPFLTYSAICCRPLLPVDRYAVPNPSFRLRIALGNSRGNVDIALSYTMVFFMEENKDFFYPNMVGSTLISLVTVIVTLVVVRVLYVLHQSGKPLRQSTPKPRSTLVVLGSGGHTAEMLDLLSVLQQDWFKPRFYIAAVTDHMSLQKARVFEGLSNDQVEVEKARFLQIYRSREVGQSYLTSVGTTLMALAHALWLMIRLRPQVILCNGPGTCIPLCVIAFLFKMMGIQWSSIFYIESIARVKRLSLSGLILYKLRIADQVYVQWPQLQNTYPRALYVGPLM